MIPICIIIVYCIYIDKLQSMFIAIFTFCVSLIGIVLGSCISLYYIISIDANSGIDIIFQLFDGNKIKGCSGVIDKNNAEKKAFDIIRKALPQNIPVLLNLESNKIDMSNKY